MDSRQDWQGSVLLRLVYSMIMHRDRSDTTAQHLRGDYDALLSIATENASPKKRKFRRTKTGCRACRRRKKKCDEGRPVCGSCARFGLKCERHEGGTFSGADWVENRQLLQASVRMPTSEQCANNACRISHTAHQSLSTGHTVVS